MAVVAVLALVLGLAVGWAASSVASNDDDDDVSAGAGSSESQGDHPDGEDMAEDEDDKGLVQLLADHHYEPPPDESLDSDTRQLLTVQLRALNKLVEKYPTVADAEADDWQRAGPFLPGLGLHYVPRDTGYTITLPDSVDGDKDEGEEVRPVLIFDSLEDDAPLAGFMVYAVEAELKGFAGPYDQAHRHTNLCIVETDEGMEAPFVADLDNVTEEMCSDTGGELHKLTTRMVHVWSVPGYESELGLFSEVNPKITCPDGRYERMPYEEVTKDDRSTCLEA